MRNSVRWYNRLAAWVYELIQDALLSLAMPVWEEEAEDDAEEQYWEDQRALADAYEQGRADEAEASYREYGHPDIGGGHA